jgi:predicted proteasome-type protease
MTYCVGLLVDTGLVMLSDSGTSAGVDQVNTFRKMATFRRPKDRVLVLMSAGNLAIAQAVTHVLQEEPEDHLERAPIFGAQEQVRGRTHGVMPCAKSNSVTARGCANKGTNPTALYFGRPDRR